MKASRAVRVSALVLAIALAGCVGTGAQHRFHVLDAPPGTARLATATSGSPTLLLMPTTAPAFYDVPAIVFSRSPGTRAYYQLNSWTEPPSRRVGELLARRLRDSSAFAVVAASTDGVRGDLVLRTDLEEIYLDATGGSGAARIALTATLTDRSTRSILGRRRFAASAPASTQDVQDAVLGFDEAVGALLDQVVAWTAETVAAK